MPFLPQPSSFIQAWDRHQETQKCASNGWVDFHQQHCELNSLYKDGKITGNYQLAQFNFLIKSIACIDKKIQGLKRNIQNLELHLDDLEQYQRSNCRILHRSDIANNENYEFLKEVINILNIKLKLPSTDVIQKQDIDICPLPASFKQ